MFWFKTFNYGRKFFNSKYGKTFKWIDVRKDCVINTDVIKPQFRELKSDIKTDNEKAMNLVNKRLDHKKVKIKFKFEGNRRQHDFNSDLIQELQSTKNKVESTSIEELEEMLGDIEKKLDHQNKLIKIADRSEGGGTQSSSTNEGT